MCFEYLKVRSCLLKFYLQDDVVMGTLTVRENFSFSAALRLPTSVSQEVKEQKVNKLIQELGLGRVADSKVRGWEDMIQKHWQRGQRVKKKGRNRT